MQERVGSAARQETFLPANELRVQASNFVGEIKTALNDIPEFREAVLKDKAFSSIEGFWNPEITEPIVTSQIRFKKNGASFLVFHTFLRTFRGLNETLVIERVSKANGSPDRESITVRVSNPQDTYWEPSIHYYRTGMAKVIHDTYETKERIKAFIENEFKGSQEEKPPIPVEIRKRKVGGYGSEREMWKAEWAKFRYSPLLERYLNETDETYIRTLDDFFEGRISTVSTISPALDSFTKFVVNHLSAA